VMNMYRAMGLQNTRVAKEAKSDMPFAGGFLVATRR
jgi:hypothetical protein